MHRFPYVKLLFSYNPNSERKIIFNNSKYNFGNKERSIMSFEVDMKTIREFDSFDDAYSILEIEQDSTKFNL